MALSVYQTFFLVLIFLYVFILMSITSTETQPVSEKRRDSRSVPLSRSVSLSSGSRLLGRVLPLGAAEPHDIRRLEDPVLVGRTALGGDLGGADSSAGDDVVLLAKGILHALAEEAHRPHGGVEEPAAGLGRLAGAEDGAGPHDDGVVEASVAQGVLDANLHLAVGGAGADEAAGAGAADEDEGLDAGGLGGAEELDVEVVVDLPLVRPAAGGGARGAEAGEDGVRRRRDGGELGGPGGRVGLDDGVEVGRAGGIGGRAAGDGRRLDARGREERGEDLGADEAGAADDGGGGEGGRHSGGVLAELYTRIAVV
ncbi:hypothetical protein BN1723_014962 [Verticillium longisporum]|uniref:Uncharacterized protein n=1 Tax=Verticillium longisporum TaxID=100787 RepID=A0A0G4MM23_VERLO|nr:hypothetical protein BN1723_014962 [Verticillium longisporum]